MTLSSQRVGAGVSVGNSAARRSRHNSSGLHLGVRVESDSEVVFLFSTPADWSSLLPNGSRNRPLLLRRRGRRMHQHLPRIAPCASGARDESYASQPHSHKGSTSRSRVSVLPREETRRWRRVRTGCGWVWGEVSKKKRKIK